MQILFFILLLRGFLFFISVILFLLRLSFQQRTEDAGPWPVWQRVRSRSWHWEPRTSCHLAPAPSPAPFLGAALPQGAHRGMLGVGTYHSKEKPAAGDRAEPAGLRGLVWSCLNT